MSREQALNSQSTEESDGLGDNGLMLNNVYLPIELIQRIMCHADEKTLLSCQLVCKRWNEIILDYVWRKKAEIKTDHKFPSDTVLEWKDFYLICAKNLFGRNLLKNHSGENGFKYWHFPTNHLFERHFAHDIFLGDFAEDEHFDEDNDGNSDGEIDDNIENDDIIEIDNANENENDVGDDNDNANDNENHNDSDNENDNDNDNDNENVNESDGDNDNDSDHNNENDDTDYDNDDDRNSGGWLVENPPIGVPTLPLLKPEFEDKEHCFVTTYYDCYKEQVINLIKDGFSANILDQIQPPIEINEWYSCRFDCPAMYNLRVRLLSQSDETLDEFVFKTILEGERQNIWFNVKHEFKNYGQGLRKISFLHGGRDRLFWAGHYGCKMAGAYVKAKISDGL